MMPSKDVSSGSSQFVMYRYRISLKVGSEEILFVIKKDYETSTEELCIKFSSYSGERISFIASSYHLGYWDSWMKSMNEQGDGVVVERVI